ncbi:Probable RNA-directed DNA polymerase from transposon BS [Eumeta japonica]|uniref:Probable RNA-directed DNA polymerase from transposon BS n=1 Tax=Eumeta variegata TaxID=151549 RepID=A0A4C1VME4_EUMVA|nr:Probable RNA-directed DNA polymerase from transposon BS [Eumeta japonica]
MDVKCNDLTDQRDRLQVLVSEMDDCRNHYEQSLLQIQVLQEEVASSFSRKRSIRGGSLILIRNNLKFKERKDIVSLSVERVIEIACVELERLVVMSVYRPLIPPELFESVMDQALCKISDKSKQIAICGDFNVDLLDASNRGGRALDLLKSYLSNRVQRVDVNGKKSSGSIVHMGVPQGSILGPFLFLVYINDLPSLVKDAHEIVLFADDTSLLFKVKRQQPTYDDVNNAISKVEKWFTANNLLLNEMKTKCIRFSLPNVRHGSGTISVRNKELEFVNSTVFLGITLDDRLQWGPHISKLAKRLSSAAYAVKKMRNLSDVETARLVYFGCFHSLMSYGILLWETPGYSENFRVAEAGRSRNLQARTSYIP